MKKVNALNVNLCGDAVVWLEKKNNKHKNATKKISSDNIKDVKIVSLDFVSNWYGIFNLKSSLMSFMLFDLLFSFLLETY